MRRLFISGNWKMNKGRQEACDLIDGIIKGMGDCPHVDIVVCPPFTFLDEASRKTRDMKLSVGAQNVFYRESGAYTGEISPLMLKSTGCKHVIAGHSERRQYFKETDAEINKKISLSLEHGLFPIFCIGETLEERNKGKTFEVLNGQIIYGLEGIDNLNVQKIVIAYEPVWAIGTGVSATSEQAEEVHRFIRNTVEKFSSKEVSESIRIIYGGSVNTGSARVLLKQENIDGALIGGASLKAEPFCEIIRIAESISS